MLYLSFFFDFENINNDNNKNDIFNYSFNNFNILIKLMFLIYY